MQELQRFAHFMVAGLAADGRHRPGAAVPVADVLDLVVPYRANRRALDIESLAEYELLVLRLCAGEDSLARLEPPEMAEACREALRQPEPALEEVPGLRDALLTLSAAMVTAAQQELATEAYPKPTAPSSPPAAEPHAAPLPAQAPPPPPAPTEQVPALPDPPGPPAQSDPGAPAREAPIGGRCPSCHGVLPWMANLAYCPGCGIRLLLDRCSACRSVVEPAWKHCPACGQGLAGSSAFG